MNLGGEVVQVCSVGGSHTGGGNRAASSAMALWHKVITTRLLLVSDPITMLAQLVHILLYCTLG
jgi:hypothetical protein